jgi:CDP-diacylglycerol--serine O-phosphatidyltransferase
MRTVKRIAIIPTLLTLGNAACGFAALAAASKTEASPSGEAYFALAGWLIIAAMVFDALDGYVARLSKTASKFGAELDSLCDAVSFGAAPAFLLLRMGPGWEPRPLLHQLLAGIATLYLVCVLLRLARFNVESASEGSAHKRFRGLPSPGAAGCIASLAILRGEPVPGLDTSVLQAGVEIAATLGALCIALLMVSRIPYPHVTKKILRGRRHFAHLVELVVAVFIIVLARQVALLLLFWTYGLGFAIRHAILRRLGGDMRPAPAGVDDVMPR